MNEVEAKLIVNDDPDAAIRIREVLAEAGLKVGPETVRKTTDTYFDTRDWDLFRYGWTCRVRKSDHESVLAMKKRGHSTNGIARREELESTVDHAPKKPADIPEGPMRTVCEEAAGGRTLEPLFSVRKIRHAFEVISESGWKGKAAFDEVSQLVAKKRKGEHNGMGYREFELEILEGSDETLSTICGLLERKLELTPARLNKFERGLRRLIPDVATQQEFVFQNKPTAAELAHAYLTRCHAEMLREEPRAWEGIDSEGVHQMRVAIRRIRTALKTLSGLFREQEVKKLDAELSWVADALGAVRDLDVYQTVVGNQSASLVAADATALIPYFDYLGKERVRLRRRLIRVLDSRRYQALKNRLQTFLTKNKPDSAMHSESAVSAARKHVIETAKKLRRDGDRIGDHPVDEELHALRIRGKRLRYVLELFVPILGERIGSTIRCVKKLQDCLGDHHDACVAQAKLRTYADRVPVRARNRGLLLALGELIHVQQIAAGNKRNAFFKLWPDLSKEIRPGRLRKKRLGG